MHVCVCVCTCACVCVRMRYSGKGMSLLCCRAQSQTFLLTIFKESRCLTRKLSIFPASWPAPASTLAFLWLCSLQTTRDLLDTQLRQNVVLSQTFPWSPLWPVTSCWPCATDPIPPSAFSLTQLCVSHSHTEV